MLLKALSSGHHLDQRDSFLLLNLCALKITNLIVITFEFPTSDSNVYTLVIRTER